MKALKIKLTLLIFLIATEAFAQQLDDIALKDSGTGSLYKMSDLKQKKGVVIIFFGNRCAYNKYYVDRIRKLSEEYKGKGLEFLLVNSFSSQLVVEESEASMKKYLQTNSISLPYLVDKDKVLKKRLGASRSPEAFLLKVQNNEYRLVYSGAIDDSPQSESDISHPYLREAIISLLENSTPEVNHTRPAGCLIR